jgi:hypothetical protein
MKTTTRSQAENLKSVFKRVVAFQPDPARAAAEDAADVTWEAEVDRILRRMYSELEGVDPFDRMMALMGAELPPAPAGFHDRRSRCNRCGEQGHYSLNYDASYCPRCDRWLEGTCRDPRCRFCRPRPVRPGR